MNDDRKQVKRAAKDLDKFADAPEFSNLPEARRAEVRALLDEIDRVIARMLDGSGESTTISLPDLNASNDE